MEQLIGRSHWLGKMPSLFATTVFFVVIYSALEKVFSAGKPDQTISI